jgi:hypothetical protein
MKENIKLSTTIGGSEYPVFINTKRNTFSKEYSHNWGEVHHCGKCDRRFIIQKMNLLRINLN